MADTSERVAGKRPRDAEATKQRLLLAATAEFAEYGLAGARMDRIAAAAGGSKPLIYMYFGNKDALFDAAISRYIEELSETVPFTPEDLGGYAGAMYDYMLANPESLRLVGWRNFERPEPTETELRSYRSKLDALAAAQAEGRVNGAYPPADLLAMTLGLVTSWIGASPALKRASGRSPMSTARLAEYRAGLVRAVAQLSATA